MSANFNEMYKKDAELIKPDEAFIERLTEQSAQAKPIKRVIKPRIAVAAAAVFAVLITAAAINALGGSRNKSDGFYAGAAPENNANYDGNAGGDAGMGGGICDNAVPNETFSGVGDAEADEYCENNSDNAAPGVNAEKQAAYTVLRKDEIEEIRLYNDGRLEIIIGGVSYWYYSNSTED